MRKDFEFSIIIPSWNNLNYLKKCVAGILQNSKQEHQIIIHVNEGSDGTTDWLKKEGILFTHSAENIGICLGFNKAFELTDKEHVMYMNDDMYVLPDWDEALAEAIPSETNWMLSSTMIEPRDSGNRSIVFANYGRDIASFRENDLLQNFKSLKRADWSGASWPPVLLPQKLWANVGCFSIEYSPGMYSDPDLSMKLWQQGVRYFRGVGQSLVYHFQSKSTKRISPNNGRHTFMKKWGITPSFFYNSYLRMGQQWKGPLNLSVNPVNDWLNRVRVRVQTSFA